MILREIHNFLESNYTVFITDPANGEWIISDAQLPDVEIKLSNGTIQFKSIIYVFDTHLIGMFVLNKIAEKLAAVGAGARVRHCQKTGAVEDKPREKFIGKFIAGAT